MDLLSKYYKVSEKLNDKNIYVSVAIRAAGNSSKPFFIKRDVNEVLIDKYEKEIDILFSIIQDEKSLIIFQSYIRDIVYFSRVYHFDPMHKTKVGSLLSCDNRAMSKKDTVVIDKQSLFKFDEV